MGTTPRLIWIVCVGKIINKATGTLSKENLSSSMNVCESLFIGFSIFCTMIRCDLAHLLTSPSMDLTNHSNITTTTTFSCRKSFVPFDKRGVGGYSQRIITNHGKQSFKNLVIITRDLLVCQ